MKINQPEMNKGMNKSVLFLPVISGILFALTLPRTGYSMLLWFSLVPLLIFISNNTSYRRIFLGGLISGSIYFITVLAPLSTLNAWWWVSPYSDFLWGNKELLLWALLIVVGVLFGGVSWGIFSLLFSRFNKSTISTAILLAISWGILEYLREIAVYGFTWGHLGFALHESPYLIQSASLFGVYGLSALIIAINILIFTIYKQKYVKFSASLNNKYLYTIVILLIFTYILGFTLVQGQKKAVNEPKQTVSVIHSSFTTEEGAGLEEFNIHKKLIEEALLRESQIIVLSENIFPVLVIDQETHLPLQYDKKDTVQTMWNGLTELSRQNKDTSIVFGAYTMNHNERYNSVVAMENGEIVGVYNKQILMFLSEAGPDFIHKFNINPLSAGTSNRSITLKNNIISPLICSEILYPRALDKLTGNIIVASSNDSVFDGKIAGLQNHIMAKFRAVENRTPLLRSVKGGISSIINSSGEVLIDSTNLDGSGVLTTTIFVK